MSSAAPEPVSPFGVCIYSYPPSMGFKDTIQFLDHCHAMGAAGIQMQLTSLDAAYADRVRAKAAEYGMFYEGIATLPKGDDTTQFEAQVDAAKRAGAALVRSACLGSRRYETFSDLASYQQFVKDAHQAIERALPILEKHKVALALENHKDWTIEQMVAIQQKYHGQYFGCCMDFGNNISLLDAPNAAAQLAPYALSTHVKDIAVAPDDAGFRMTEVPLGEGVIDVPALISAARAHRPNIRFSLEMITRDPLLIPCLTDKYWATFPDRDGIYLARALTLVHQKGRDLPHGNPPAKADENVALCLRYGREHFA
jgi:sugar phosphate isomerase/epimerase